MEQKYWLVGEEKLIKLIELLKEETDRFKGPYQLCQLNQLYQLNFAMLAF